MKEYWEEDCESCSQVRQNCECHIPSEEKHCGLYALAKVILPEQIDPDPEMQKHLDEFSKIVRKPTRNRF